MDNSSKLVPHSEFDPNAFVGDEAISQRLCNFVLALSLVYNDYKFYTMCYVKHIDAKPKGDPDRNSMWGEHEGIKLHLVRLHIAFAHELFNLIQGNKNLLEDVFLKEVIRIMPRKARESWKTLIDATLMEESSPKKSNPLFMIRNKMAFHYDAKELFSGYHRGFFKNGEKTEDACISIGNNLEESRFYFADLAVSGYLKKEIGLDSDDFFRSFGKTMKDVNIALHHIVISFIQRRNFSWKSPKP